MNKQGLILENIPNFLTILRIILTFVVIYLIFTNAKIGLIVAVFAAAALTDFFDGRLARRFKWTSEFGRKADMIADRFLWIGTAFAFLISLSFQGKLDGLHGLQLLLIMTREVISAPFALIAFFSGNAFPKARYIAKVLTFIQGFALPALLLSIYYPKFAYLSWALALTCAVLGFYSALYYMRDIHAPLRHERKK